MHKLNPLKPLPTSIPFGIHAGKPLSDVPISYLWWVSEWEKTRPELKRAVDNELIRRGKSKKSSKSA